jgi:hypothetical protein
MVTKIYEINVVAVAETVESGLAVEEVEVS